MRPTVRQGALVAPKPFAKALSTRGALGERTASRPRVLTPLLCALGVRGVTRPTRIRSPAPRGAEAPRRDRCHFCGGLFRCHFGRALGVSPPGGVERPDRAGGAFGRGFGSKGREKPVPNPLPARVPRLESARTRARTISVRPGCTFSVRPNSINWETGEVADGPGAPVTRTPGRGWSGRPPSEAFVGGKPPAERSAGARAASSAPAEAFAGGKAPTERFAGGGAVSTAPAEASTGGKPPAERFAGASAAPSAPAEAFVGGKAPAERSVGGGAAPSAPAEASTGGGAASSAPARTLRGCRQPCDSEGARPE